MAELRARYTALNSDLWPPVDADLAIALARFSSENSAPQQRNDRDLMVRYSGFNWTGRAAARQALPQSVRTVP